MGKYRIELKLSAAGEIERLSPADLRRILSRIEALGENPRPYDCKKLSAQEKYSCEDDRIMYSIEDYVLIISVVKAAHRKDLFL